MYYWFFIQFIYNISTLRSTYENKKFNTKNINLLLKILDVQFKFTYQRNLNKIKITV